MKEFFGQKSPIILILSGVIVLILSLIRLSWGVGFLLGVSVMLVNLLLIQIHVDQLMFTRKTKFLGNFFYYTLANMMLGVPMLISVLYPAKSNLLAAAFGLLFLKYAFYIYEIFFKKKEN